MLNNLLGILVVLAGFTSPVWVAYLVIKFIEYQDRKKRGPVKVAIEDIVEPPEGFKNGGWYQGHQFFNGSFSKEGEVHEDYLKGQHE